MENIIIFFFYLNNPLKKFISFLFKPKTNNANKICNNTNSMTNNICINPLGFNLKIIIATKKEAKTLLPKSTKSISNFK
jgi:hypothetical protein